MASAAAIQNFERNLPAVKPAARGLVADLDAGALADRNFAASGEANARALQARLDRAFSGELAMHGPAKLGRVQSTAIIVGASATLWAMIGYGAFLYLY